MDGLMGLNLFRIALANLRFPATPEDSVAQAEQAIAQASVEHADLICFPECFVPGYRLAGRPIPPPDTVFLERARSAIAEAAGKASMAVILGTERVVGSALIPSALVINRDGTIAGFQDKVQLDPSEEAVYSPGSGRRVFQTGPLTFGIAICHEGWRYPETVRWAARQGAQIVFHPHFHEAEPDGYIPTGFGDPANTFHEKALLCRAAENTCWIASVNCASEGSPSTSAVVRPGGTLLSYQPYGKEGLLIADIDLAEATGLMAARCKSSKSDPVALTQEVTAAARSVFDRQGLMREFGAAITVLAAGCCVIELPFSERVGQQSGFFHGGAIGAVADTAGGCAAFTLFPPGGDPVTVEYKINFLRPAKGERIVAEGTVVRAGRSVSVSRVDVFVESPGKARELCAVLQQSVMRVPQ